MIKDKFEEFISKQKKKSSSIEIDWDIQRSEWLQHLDLFYESIELFLKPYTENKTIELSFGTKKIIEEYIGEYEAKTAQITIGSNRIKLDPIGTNLIGAKGRVDLIGPNGKIKFVLVNESASAPKISVRVWIQGEEPPTNEEEQPKVISWVWRIATPPPKIRYFPLEKESFLDALMEVSNG